MILWKVYLPFTASDSVGMSFALLAAALRSVMVLFDFDGKMRAFG